MRNWGLLTAPLGIFLCGMTVLYLKMQGAMQKVTTNTLQDPLTYVPYLLVAIFLTIVIQMVVIRRKLDTKMVFESNFFMVNFVAFWENFIPFCS